MRQKSEKGRKDISREKGIKKRSRVLAKDDDGCAKHRVRHVTTRRLTPRGILLLPSFSLFFSSPSLAFIFVSSFGRLNRASRRDTLLCYA